MFKQWRSIMRTGAGFRMALKAERRFIGAVYSLQTAVKQLLVGWA
jgi:hypothetical protein